MNLGQDSDFFSMCLEVKLRIKDDPVFNIQPYSSKCLFDTNLGESRMAFQLFPCFLNFLTK